MLLQYKGLNGITITPLNNSIPVTLVTDDIINVTDVQGQALLNMFGIGDFIELNDMKDLVTTAQTGIGSPEALVVSRSVWDMYIDTNANPNVVYVNPVKWIDTGWLVLTSETPPTPPTPVAEFTSDVQLWGITTVIQFTDESTNSPTSWFWEFNDWHTSHLQNPTHVFDAVWNYDVSLTARNAGWENTVTKIAYIVIVTAPTAQFSVNNQSPTNIETVQFSDLSTGLVDSYLWDFGDGEYSTEQNPTHIYQNVATYDVSLQVTGIWGSTTEVKTSYMNVTQWVPTSIFSADNLMPTTTEVVQFTDESTNNPQTRLRGLWEFWPDSLDISLPLDTMLRWTLENQVNVGKIFFNTDGTKLYQITNLLADLSIQEYTLWTAYDMSTMATGDSIQIDSIPGTADANVFLNKDWNKLYRVNVTSVDEYTLDWALSTFTFVNTFDLGFSLVSIRFSDDWTKIFGCNDEGLSSDTRMIPLTVARDITSVDLLWVAIWLSSTGGEWPIIMSDDGRFILKYRDVGTSISQYNLLVPFDITTASFATVLDLSGFALTSWIALNPSNTNLYVASTNVNEVAQFTNILVPGTEVTNPTQNPTYTFQTLWLHTITLTTSNDWWSSSLTRTQYIDVIAPWTTKANFIADNLTPLVWVDAVQFTDLSSDTPTGWSWDFGYWNLYWILDNRFSLGTLYGDIGITVTDTDAFQLTNFTANLNLETFTIIADYNTYTQADLWWALQYDYPTQVITLIWYEGDLNWQVLIEITTNIPVYWSILQNPLFTYVALSELTIRAVFDNPNATFATKFPTVDWYTFQPGDWPTLEFVYVKNSADKNEIWKTYVVSWDLWWAYIVWLKAEQGYSKFNVVSGVVYGWKVEYKKFTVSLTATNIVGDTTEIKVGYISPKVTNFIVDLVLDDTDVTNLCTDLNSYVWNGNITMDWINLWNWTTPKTWSVYVKSSTNAVEVGGIYDLVRWYNEWVMEYMLMSATLVSTPTVWQTIAVNQGTIYGWTTQTA